MNLNKLYSVRFAYLIIVSIIFMNIGYVNSEIINKKHKVNNKSNSEIEFLINNGIDALYDLHYEEYKKVLIYKAYQNDGPEYHIIGFSNMIISKLSKLSNEIAPDRRRFFWDFVYVTLLDKMMLFMDDADVCPRHGLERYKPKVEEYIRKECRIHSIFG